MGLEIRPSIRDREGWGRMAKESIMFGLYCGEWQDQLMVEKLISRLADHDHRVIPICLVCDVLQELLGRKFFLFF